MPPLHIQLRVMIDGFIASEMFVGKNDILLVLKRLSVRRTCKTLKCHFTIMSVSIKMYKVRMHTIESLYFTSGCRLKKS